MENRRYKILFVEDDEVDMMAFERFARKKSFPYDYVTARSAKEAFGIVESEKFDAVITDYLLGDGTAFDLFDRIKDTPIIVVTGTGDEETAVLAMKSGAYDYLIKDQSGYYLKTLPVTVNNAISRKQAENELKKHKEHLEKLVEERTAELQAEIAKREKAAAALKESEESLKETSTLLEATLDAIPDVLGIQDSHHGIIRYNEAGYQFLNMAYEDVKGKKCFELIGRNTPCEICATSETYKTKKPARVEKYVEELDLWLDVRAYPILDETGGIVRIIEHLRDITERKKAGEMLQESEEKCRSLFETNPDGILMADSKTRKIEFANPAICRMLGYTEEKLQQMGMYDIHPEKDLEYLLSEFEAIMVGEKTRTEGIRCLRKDGTIVYADITGATFYMQGRQYSAGFFRDMTEHNKAEAERKELEVQLQRAQKMEALGTLAGGVAHDLNNILIGIVSYPDLLLMQLPEDSAMRQPLLTIKESGQRAADTVQDLLTLARRGVKVTEVTNLNNIVLDYLKSPEYKTLMLDHPRVKIETNPDSHLLNVLGSPIHLSKTVMNLISNAVEAITSGGKIVISTSNQYVDRPIRGYDDVEEGDYVILTISDDGVGIPQEDLNRIFEPFYTKKAMGRSGTGLGMAVVWGTVKDHNGYINVDSVVGKGTTFTLYFPITRRKSVKAIRQLSLGQLMGNGETILIVDDVLTQRELAGEMLETLAYNVTTAPSGEAAVEYMKDNSADLLVLDMIMDTGIDGLETYKHILEFHPNQKAIIVSGFSETDRVKEAQNLGAGQYVKKPYVLNAIGAAVKAELDAE